MNQSELVAIAQELFGDTVWIGALRHLQGAEAVRSGAPLKEAAERARTTQGRLREIANSLDVARAVFGLSPHEIDAKHRQRAIGTLGQLLVGRAAESAFEDIYASEMHTHELELRDLRESRSDTDYRLYNGKGRPVYRINIKFHGALFQRARELVELESEDCFTLATYKIHGALKKQEAEGLPYIFAVVGVRTLSGEKVGQRIPSRFIDAVAFMYQSPKATHKRDFEDAVVEYLVRSKEPVFQDTYEEVYAADWYINIREARRSIAAREALPARLCAEGSTFCPAISSCGARHAFFSFSGPHPAQTISRDSSGRRTSEGSDVSGMRRVLGSVHVNQTGRYDG